MNIEEIQSIMNAKTELLNKNEVYRGRLIIPLITRRAVSSFNIQTENDKIKEVVPALELVNNQPSCLRVLDLDVAKLINDHRPRLRKAGNHKFIICDVAVTPSLYTDYNDIDVRDVTEVNFSKTSITSYLYAVGTFPYKSAMAFKLQLFLSQNFLK